MDANEILKWINENVREIRIYADRSVILKPYTSLLRISYQDDPDNNVTGKSVEECVEKVIGAKRKPVIYEHLKFDPTDDGYLVYDRKDKYVGSITNKDFLPSGRWNINQNQLNDLVKFMGEIK